MLQLGGRVTFEQVAAAPCDGGGMGRGGGIPPSPVRGYTLVHPLTCGFTFEIAVPGRVGWYTLLWGVFPQVRGCTRLGWYRLVQGGCTGDFGKERYRGVAVTRRRHWCPFR